MVRKYLFASAFVLAATPALAAGFDDCTAPYAPAALNGKTATEEQMKHALSDVKDFIKWSDDYQDCVNNTLIAMKKAATKSKDKQPLDPAYQTEAEDRIHKNQLLKEKVAAEFNTAAKDYNDTHPSTKSP